MCYYINSFILRLSKTIYFTNLIGGPLLTLGLSPRILSYPRTETLSKETLPLRLWTEPALCKLLQLRLKLRKEWHSLLAIAPCVFTRRIPKLFDLRAMDSKDDVKSEWWISLQGLCSICLDADVLDTWLGDTWFDLMQESPFVTFPKFFEVRKGLLCFSGGSMFQLVHSSLTMM